MKIEDLKEREIECILACREATNDDALAWAAEAMAITLFRIANALEKIIENTKEGGKDGEIY